MSAMSHPANTMLIASIFFEIAVVIITLMTARSGKPYLYALSFTFAIYVLYDSARLFQVDVQQGILSFLFLCASVSALIAVWGLYKR